MREVYYAIAHNRRCAAILVNTCAHIPILSNCDVLSGLCVYQNVPPRLRGPTLKVVDIGCDRIDDDVGEGNRLKGSVRWIRLDQNLAYAFSD